MSTASQGVMLQSPGGRYVSGSHLERQTEGYEGEKYEEGKGPFTVGIAIRKDAQGIGDFLTGIYHAAVNSYPGNQQMAQRIGQEMNSGFALGAFAFKIKDGDKPNQRTNEVNPNTAGCWVFWLTSYLNPIKVTHWNIPGISTPNNAEIAGNLLKRGDYVDFSVNVKGNGNVDRTAGIYMNPLGLRLLGYGEAIVGGVSTETAFGSAPAPVIPQGASLTPVGPQPSQQQPQQQGGVQVPGMGGQQQGGVQVPGMGGQQYQQPVQQQPQQQYQQPVQQQYQQPQQQYQQPVQQQYQQPQGGVQVPGLQGGSVMPGAEQNIQQQQPQPSTTGYPSNGYPQILQPQGQQQQPQVPGMGGGMPQIPGM